MDTKVKSKKVDGFDWASAIKTYRKSRRLNQNRFGVLVGMAQKVVSRLESGAMPYRKSRVRLLSIDAFKIPYMEYLLNKDMTNSP
jgi:transcriptional regulator with XRE-family HTH domain